MSERLKSIGGAFATSLVIGFVGVQYVYGPLAAADAPAGALVPAATALAIYVLLGVLFFDWVDQQVHAPVKSAMIVAVSQILLVDVYYVLNGTRGIAAAAASAAVLVASWGGAGFVYGKLLGGGGAAAGD
jgi:hypothetical protein